MIHLKQVAVRALSVLELARESHGVMLMTDPMQDPWKTRKVSEKIQDTIKELKVEIFKDNNIDIAIEALKALESDDYIIENMLIDLEGMQKLAFDEWVEENEEWLTQYAAETGSDRESDFDVERFEETMYEAYLNE